MPAQAPTQAPELKQIALGLKHIIDSVYKDGIDALMNVDVSGGGTISGQFRDGPELFDFTITPNGKLSYVETDSDRRDSCLEKTYLSTRVSDSASSAYVQGMLQQTLRRDRSKGRQCQKGKPCGSSCVAKGYKCSVELGGKQQVVLKQVRGAIAEAKSNGTWKKALIAGGVLAGAALLAAGGMAIASQMGNSTPAAQAHANGETKADPGAAATAQIVVANQGQPTGRRTNQPEPTNNPTLVTPPEPGGAIVVASERNATPEENEAYQRSRRTNQTQPINYSRAIPIPPTPAKNFAEALDLSAFAPESQAYLRSIAESVDKTVKVSGLTEMAVTLTKPEEGDSAVAVYRWRSYVLGDKVVDTVPDSIGIHPDQLSRTPWSKQNPSGISKATPGPEEALLHEMAHAIDHVGIGNRKDGLASEHDHPAMKEFFQVANQSTPIRELRRLGRNTRDPEIKKRVEELLRPSEIFARAFTHYVAAKSEMPGLKDVVKETRWSYPPRGWFDKDFKQVEGAMDKMFKELGMR